MPHVGNEPRGDDRNDGGNDASRGVAVVCPRRGSTTTATSIDLLDTRLHGPLNHPTTTAASTNGSDRALPAAAPTVSRRVLSP
jgi:hypothetical protein